MLQLVLYGLLALLLAGGLFLLASRFLPAGEQIAPPLRDEPPWDLPADRMLHPEDVDSVRLPVALRGYRFAETDILLDRLAGELRARDMEIARLRTQRPAVPTPPGAGPGQTDERGPAAPAAVEQPQDEAATGEPADVERREIEPGGVEPSEITPAEVEPADVEPAPDGPSGTESDAR